MLIEPAIDVHSCDHTHLFGRKYPYTNNIYIFHHLIHTSHSQWLESENYSPAFAIPSRFESELLFVIELVLLKVRASRIKARTVKGRHHQSYDYSFLSLFHQHTAYTLFGLAQRLYARPTMTHPRIFPSSEYRTIRTLFSMECVYKQHAFRPSTSCSLLSLMQHLPPFPRIRSNSCMIHPRKMLSLFTQTPHSHCFSWKKAFSSAYALYFWLGYCCSGR